MRKHHQVREGQIVRVIDGPFTGFRGEVKEVDEQTAKVAVQYLAALPRWTWHLGRSNWCQKIQTESNVRFAPLRGLKSDISRGPRSAMSRHHPVGACEQRRRI